MSQQEFEPDATVFDPGFTEPDVSTSGHIWVSSERPDNPNAPGRWDTRPESVQPDELSGQGVFVPGRGDYWGTAPTPSFGTPPHKRGWPIRRGPLAMAALILIGVSILVVLVVIVFPHSRAIRLAPIDDPGAAASQSALSVRPGRSTPHAQPPAITRTGAERVLANYWRVSNVADQSRSDAFLATIEAGSSYAMDAGDYQTSQVTDPSTSQYAPFTAENAVYYIPHQPAGIYPRWFAARITYATLASPRRATGAGYVLFVQDSKDAAWKNVLEPYLPSSAGPAALIETDAQGYAIQATLASAAGLTAAPAQIPQLTAQSLDGGSAALKNPGNLADLHDQAYFQARLPAGSAVTDRHSTSGLVFALKVVGGGALVFYHLTAQLSLTAPPGQNIQISIPASTPRARPSPSLRSITPTSSPASSQPDRPARPSSPMPPASPDEADQPSMSDASPPISPFTGTETTPLLLLRPGGSRPAAQEIIQALALPAPGAAPEPARALPMTRLQRLPRETSMLYGIGRVDASGRVANREIIEALHWEL